jgi:hypothetical protein
MDEGVGKPPGNRRLRPGATRVFAGSRPGGQGAQNLATAAAPRAKAQALCLLVPVCAQPE